MLNDTKSKTFVKNKLINETSSALELFSAFPGAFKDCHLHPRTSFFQVYGKKKTCSAATNNRCFHLCHIVITADKVNNFFRKIQTILK